MLPPGMTVLAVFHSSWPLPIGTPPSPQPTALARTLSCNKNNIIAVKVRTMAHVPLHWQKEPGARVAGSRDLDRAKVQAPCIVRTPDGRYRLFYTAVGPAPPFAECQGYVLRAPSADGLAFTPAPGIRIAPDPR